MTSASIQALLEAVATGRTSPTAALAKLENPLETDLGFAVVDQQRSVRLGLPEVVYGEGKSVDQLVQIAHAIAARGENVLVTRLGNAERSALQAAFPDALVNDLGRTVRVERRAAAAVEGFRAAVVCAGTTDLPVFEECSETLAAAGIAHDRVTDVGVAGIHRLFSRMPILQSADALVVIAGMEGALPSVVGGLVAMPVVAVPTSVGYGAGAAGVAALLGMLSSCASGITVCNIDNGFGAAMAVHRIARLLGKKTS